MRKRSARVTCNKKGGNQHNIPYTMTCIYVHPPVDSVPSELQVDVLVEDQSAIQVVATIEEAIEVYMQAFRRKFRSREGTQQRRRNLQRFLRYLNAQGRSLELKDLTFSDGQHFLDTLTNSSTGLPLSPNLNKQYRSALRSFSRFLQKAGIIEKDLFFPLRIK